MREFFYVFLASTVACLIMSISPSLAFVGGIGWGMLLLLGGYFVSTGSLGLIFGANILLLYGLTGNSILFFLLIFGMPSFIMGLQLARQKGYYELQKYGLLAALLLVSIFLGLTYYNGEDTLNNMQMVINDQIEESMQLYEDTGLIQLDEGQGVSREAMEKNLADLGHWVLMHLPAFYFLQAILAVFLVLSLSAFLARKKNLPVLRHKPFADEIMPWQFAWVIILGLILWLLGRDDLNNIYYIGSNLLLVAVPVAIYYGIASVTFWVKKISPYIRPWLILFFIINILFLPLAIILFLGAWGIFDALVDFRKLDPKKEELK